MKSLTARGCAPRRLDGGSNAAAAPPLREWERPIEFNAGVDVGAAWALVGAMAGISPAVAWPQSGTVTA